eukprot:TRINITY_DN14145_c0_g1_i1.p1 TRINITY_DN14145_c0_g1~~TRINITY_DN14145_c0_g1_i1.p1  ORF type:complete len:714 (+),score=146.09 TRINITY_DN14145_c0_g1_i1:670-2811(+)
MAPNNDQHPAASDAFLGCGHCSEAFPGKSQLEVHIKMIHPGKEFASVPAPLPSREQRLLHKTPASAISKNMPLSEVARHCTPEDCWVALNGKVYDLTEFMDRHPGGPTTILAWAGKDASKMFNDIHKGIKIEQYLRPEAYLGDLGVDENLMSDSFWHTLREARIAEVREELDRVMSQSSEKIRKADSIQCLLQDKTLDPDLRGKLLSLETQKRVALDAEDYTKALEIKKASEELLAETEHEHLHGVAFQPKSGSAGIPLSEVARHNKPHDCWIALNGVVYDLTDFLLHHPEQRNSILAWAGRDATAIWDKIPGRFPSSTWMEYFMRPEARMGEVGAEAEIDPTAEQINQLQDELRRLEGPSEEDIQAFKAAAASKVPDTTAGPKLSEEARFPRLQEFSAGKDLPFFTRAEVAKHSGPVGGSAGTEPYMILHNRVYDLRPLLGNHPGGDDIVLARAGTDATSDFEVFEHSEKARIQRDRDMLVGRLVPAECKDWAAEASAAMVEKQSSEFSRYLRYKAADAITACVAWYAYQTFHHRKALSQFTYSRGLRHMHLLMAIGIFGSIGSAHAAARSEGLAKKRLLLLHKQSGLAMLFALIVRACFRLRSGIPPRFPGNRMVQFVETQSLRAFYLLLLALPLSGMVNEYYLKWAAGSETTGSDADDKRNDRLAKNALSVHKGLGKFLEFAWLPFHLGYTTLYHYSKGRGVIRKVSPFI